jgi:hypothetical protein
MDNLDKNERLFKNMSHNIRNTFLEAYCSSYKIFNLPPEIPEFYLKRELFLNGTLVFFKHNGQYMCLPYSANEWDIYGEPLCGEAYTYNLNYYYWDITNAVVIYPSYNKNQAIHHYIHTLCNEIASLETSLYRALQYSGTGLVITSEELGEGDEDKIYDILEGKGGFVRILRLQNGWQITDFNSEQRIKFIQGLNEMRKELWNSGFEFLGISTAPLKKAQQSEIEIDISNYSPSVNSKHKTLLLDSIHRINQKFHFEPKIEIK